MNERQNTRQIMYRDISKVINAPRDASYVYNIAMLALDAVEAGENDTARNLIAKVAAEVNPPRWSIMMGEHNT